MLTQGYLFVRNTVIPVSGVRFVSFWLEPEAAAARVSLVTTALLALVTLMTSMRMKTSQLTYITAMDIWFFACLVFVAANLLEFGVAYLLAVSCVCWYNSARK